MGGNDRRRLEAARRLIGADLGAGPRPAGAVHQLPRTIVPVRLRRREPQHGHVIWLHFHPPRIPAFAEDAVNARQVVARHIEQQMVLEMVVHVIGRDEQPLKEAGAGGARADR